MTAMKGDNGKAAVKTISRAAVQALHDHVAHISQGIIGAGETHQPIIALAEFDDQGGLKGVRLIGGLQEFFADNAGKDQLAGIMRRLLALLGVDALILVAEAWALIRDASVPIDLAALAKSGGVKAQPDRVECVTINITTKSDQYFSINPIIRKAGKAPRMEIGKLQGAGGASPDGGEQSGRFALLSE